MPKGTLAHRLIELRLDPVEATCVLTVPPCKCGETDRPTANWETVRTFLVACGWAF